MPHACSIDPRPVAEVEAAFGPSDKHGADIRFHGVVRDSEDGRRIDGIDYSFYEGMALRELEAACAASAEENPESLVQVHHVVGFVPAGVASIVIRVQTKHSAEGFEQARELLAAIKKSVPIWKEPRYADETTG